MLAANIANGREEEKLSRHSWYSRHSRPLPSRKGSALNFSLLISGFRLLTSGLCSLLGYQDDSGVLRMVKRLEREATEDKELRRRQEFLGKLTLDTANLKSGGTLASCKIPDVLLPTLPHKFQQWHLS